MMGADDVRAVINHLRHAGLVAWLDGGWGVDALLGAQTRPHDDLDIVLAADQLDEARAALRALGYALAAHELPTRCVLADATDRRIDVHPVTFDRDGGGIQQQPDGSTFRYPPEGLTGIGWIAGEAVPCLTAELQLRCHLSYEPDDNDRHDVRLLCARFDLDLPEAYKTA